MPADPSKTDRQQRLSQLIGEYFRRIAAEEQLDLDTFCQEHADYAEELRLELNKQTGTISFTPGADTQPSKAPSPPSETIDLSGTPEPDQVTIDLAAGVFSVSDVAQQLADTTHPRSFGEYDLIEVIGRGGMGIVCKARQRSIDRVVALKMIRDGQLASGGEVERFFTEAHAAGSLTHPNIVTVHEAGIVEGHHFYSMEFIEGEDLGKRLKREPLRPEEIAPLLIPVVKAIDHAHKKGVLHRDLKPGNILIDEQGHPLVTDFGLAREVSKVSNLTPEGSPMGTPGYMPPEQAAGRVEDLGPTVDVYSLGAVLYQMLTERPPFVADSLADMIMKILHQDPPTPRSINWAVNRDLETICLKCLQKDPKKRYQTARELADDLQRAHEGKPIHAQPTSLPTKLWHWLRDVPLVAALVHRRVVHPTPLHKLTQWLFLTIVVLAAVSLIAWQLHTPGMPRQVRILAGHSEGKYHAVASDLAAAISQHAELPSSVIETEGSVENHRRLLAGEAEIALIQAESLVSNKLAVAAPLYYEFVLIMVRHEAAVQKEIDEIADLARCSVALGPPGSGMRQGSLRVLGALEIEGSKLSQNEADYLHLLVDPTLDAAIVITGLENPGVLRVLATGDFDLLPLPAAERVAMRIPSFHAGHIFSEQLPPVVGSHLDDSGLATLFTPAYLVVRRDAPDVLVSETLATLYDHNHQLLTRHALLPLADAAQWRAIPRHPAAEAFFEERIP